MISGITLEKSIFMLHGEHTTVVQYRKRSAFRRAFVAKGRMRPLLESIPVRVVVNKRAALLGAARASLHAEDRR